MEISNSGYTAKSFSGTTGVTTNTTGSGTFQDSLSAESSSSYSSTPDTNWVTSDPNAPVSKDGSTWTPVAPGVEEGTLPDGTFCTYVNMDIVLTPEDKALVGWPCDDDPQMEAVAGMIAGDRACGDLTGPVTLDYILGNPNRYMEGLGDRIPGTTDDTIKLLVSNLTQWDVQQIQDEQSTEV